jgi:ParB/Sulfiredoxin domain
MKVTVPLDKIKPNPWRSLDLFPIDEEHVDDLVKSITRHDFWGGLKARKIDGFYEAACGAHRIEAARRYGLKSIDILVGDMSDDEMIDLMCRENGTQAGSNAASTMSDVVAVTRRLITIMLTKDFREIHQKYPGLFEGEDGFARARGKLLARIGDPNKDGGIGRDLIIRYLGGKDSPRNEQEIRDAIATLKMSGRYDDFVDDALAKIETEKFAKSDAAKTSAKKTEVIPKPKPVRKRTVDERCARVFKNDTQFRAFRDAVTTEAAKRFIPVDQQMKVAKMIVADMGQPGFKKKQLGAAFIKQQITFIVRDASRAQKDINAKEKEALYREQRDLEIKAEVKSASNSYRSLTSALGKLTKLAQEFPGHPYLGDLGGKLGMLAKLIEHFRKLTNY